MPNSSLILFIHPSPHLPEIDLPLVSVARSEKLNEWVSAIIGANS